MSARFAHVVLGPKGMPEDIVKTIDAACEKSVLDERFKSATRQSSQQAIYRNRIDYARMLAEDSAIKRDVVDRAGVKDP